MQGDEILKVKNYIFLMEINIWDTLRKKEVTNKNNNNNKEASLKLKANVEVMVKYSKAVTVQTWTAPESFSRLRLPDFMTIGIWRW
jgi:hypothetical protein